MDDDRKKPVWPCILAMLIGLPVTYVASFGPACWLAGREMIPTATIEVYRPLARLAARSPDPVMGVYMVYVQAFTPESAEVSFGCLMIKDEYMRQLAGDDDYPINDFSQ
jgi:hypothetical protein